MSYQREITDKHPASSTPVADFDPNRLIGWLEGQAKAHKLKYLLAHADDGVIWGRVDKDGHLLTSCDALRNAKAKETWDVSRLATAKISLAPLRLETLQQARLFATHAEIHVWQDGDGVWHGRLIRDVGKGEAHMWLESFDEPQLLWGTHGTQLAYDFTLLEDGAQGLHHAVPMPLILDTAPAMFGRIRPMQLLVRHYLSVEGLARIVASRLVTLKKE